MDTGDPCYRLGFRNRMIFEAPFSNSMAGIEFGRGEAAEAVLRNGIPAAREISAKLLAPASPRS